MVAARAVYSHALSPGCQPRPPGAAGAGRVAGLGGGGLESRRSPGLLREVPGRTPGTVLLRAVPGGVRPGTAQGVGRLVHPDGDRQVSGGPRSIRCSARSWTWPTAWPIPNVVVFDPCCGTAVYLVEVLAKIAETLKAKGDDAALASDLKKAAMTRVFGFEILPAPFVVSHLRLGLLLQRLGRRCVPRRTSAWAST